jgi:hypothetical protein
MKSRTSLVLFVIALFFISGCANETPEQAQFWQNFRNGLGTALQGANEAMQQTAQDQQAQEIQNLEWHDVPPPQPRYDNMGNVVQTVQH